MTSSNQSAFILIRTQSASSFISEQLTAIITRVVSESTAVESTYIVTSVEDGKEYHVDGKDVNVPHGVLFYSILREKERAVAVWH
jgi:hypothetical protein